MNKIIQDSRMKEALDLLLEGDIDISDALGEGGLIKRLTKAVLERALAVEMDNHLGYDRYDRSDFNNSRNGHYNKNLITDNGVIELNVPRDRNGNFEPAIVPKKQNRAAGLDKKILSLYAKGMSLSDIKQQIHELYEADISESLISKITDGVMDEVRSWQSRPLESIYPIVYFDCLVVKVRHDKRIINKAVYVALGIDLSGKKDILGLWISENEGAKFWLGNLTEMKNRGMQDMLIACTDNLTGMSEAISAVYSKCEHQLCIVHQIRNSLRYVSYKDRKDLVSDLKPIYQASSEETALSALELFAERWDKKYPQISKSWYHNWSNLVVFMQYPPSIKKIIYTTNAIESLNSQLRKVTNNKRVFPSDDAVFKSLYLTIDYITSKWNMPISNWNEAMAHFLIKFEDRI
jgi:transposase-like protein